MITLYRAGNSVLHRMNAGSKLLFVVLWVGLLSVFGNNPMIWAAGLVLALALYLVGYGSPALFAKQLWSLRWLLLLTFVGQWFFAGITPAINNSARLSDGLMVAILFTLTTPHSQIFDTIERASGPLRRVAVKPEILALSLSLTIRSIPVLLQLSASIVEAQRARGHKPSTVQTVVPLLIGALKYADDLSEALAARGVEA